MTAMSTLVFSSTFQSLERMRQAPFYLRADKPTKQRRKQPLEGYPMHCYGFARMTRQLMFKAHDTQRQLAFNRERAIGNNFSERNFSLWTA